MPQVEVSRLSWLQMPAIQPATELRKTYLSVLRIIFRRKLRNSEMEETWRAKKEWRCGERSCPRQHNTLTSSPLVPTHELSECQNLWSFIFMFLIFIEVSINRDIDWIFGQRWLISTSVPSLLLTGEGVSNLEFHYWLCQPILLVHEISWYLWKTKIPQFSGVLDHEPGQGSNMDNKMIVKRGRGKRPGHSAHFPRSFWLIFIREE